MKHRWRGDATDGRCECGARRLRAGKGKSQRKREWLYFNAEGAFLGTGEPACTRVKRTRRRAVQLVLPGVER